MLRRLLAVVLVVSAWTPTLTYELPRWSPPSRLTCLRTTPRAIAMAYTPPPSPEEKAKAAAALEAAEKKLEQLNEIDPKGAPTSWADLGLPAEPVAGPEVPAALQVAPLVLGAVSIILFILNGIGAFGDGPDLDALVEEWSKIE